MRDGPASDFEATWRSVLRGERLPAVLVDLDAFERNARHVAATVRAAGGRRIRPATKSVRVPALLRRLAAVAPIYQGWMTYAAAEARAARFMSPWKGLASCRPASWAS